MNSLRRDQEGIYTSYELERENLKVKILLLDNRYFKDQDPDFPMLGKKQWLWLEDELKKSNADLHLIVSGLSILSPKMIFTEEWADYPKEVQRLKNLLNTYKVKAPILVTGDKHFASIFQKDGLIEIMSSGMTHTVPRFFRPLFSSQYPKTFFGLNYGVIEIHSSEHTKAPIVLLKIKNKEGKTTIFSRFAWSRKSWVSDTSFLKR